MKITALIISFLLLFSACSQIKSETDQPKQFLSNDALAFDLVGKVRNVIWTETIPGATGNDAELYDGWYKGRTDTVKLQYDKNINLVKSHMVRYSMETNDDNSENLIYVDNHVLLDTFSNISKEYLFQTDYSGYIKDKKLIAQSEYFKFYYNSFGDLKERRAIDEGYFRKKQQSTRLEYKYKYDKFGNWIERIVISGAENNRSVICTSRRTIEYR